MRYVPILLATAVLAGCGGSDGASAPDEPSATPTVSEAERAALDSAAKSDARNAVSELESCFVTVQDYRECERVPAGVELDATLSRYALSVRSESGTTFRIVKGRDYAITRACEPAGTGGCSADGTW